MKRFCVKSFHAIQPNPLLISQSSESEHYARQMNRSLIPDAIRVNGISIDTINLLCNRNGDFLHPDISPRCGREAPLPHRR